MTGGFRTAAEQLVEDGVAVVALPVASSWGAVEQEAARIVGESGLPLVSFEWDGVMLLLRRASWWRVLLWRLSAGRVSLV